MNTLYIVTINNDFALGHTCHSLEDAKAYKAKLLDPEKYFNFIGENIEIHTFTKDKTIEEGKEGETNQIEL